MHTRRMWFQKLALGLGGLVLSACQNHSPADPALRLWNRAAYGPCWGDLERFRLDDFLEEQLHPEQIRDADCQRRLDDYEFVTLDKSLEQLWRDHYLPMDEAESDEEWENVALPYTETVQATWLRAVYSRRQLQEVLSEFWHNHFNVYGPHDDVAPLLAAYDRDVIRPHVLGNFGSMLQAVARHPVMLLYLNNSSNEVAGPNENYARELLELHTLGPGNYQDNDVREVARCFTGWGLDDGDDDNLSGGSGRFMLRPERHDRFNKFILGQYLRSDQDGLREGSLVLERLAQHPATARHVCLKLCRRFVSDDPPEGLVSRAARLFLKQREQPDQLRQVVALILRSPELLDGRAVKFKRPFEFAVSLARALEVELDPDEDFLDLFAATGQPLFGRPTPDGYPDRADGWRHSSSWLFRWRLVEPMLEQLPQATFDWQRRLLGRPCSYPEILAGCHSPRELVAMLAMGPDFQVR
ncbi:DUF1800 domain-containing protein [bacterium]|nr:DUF1800 domain-containing protein [bacterium]